MPGNLPPSITVCADREFTHYKSGRGRSYISTSGNYGRSVVGASESKLRLSGWRRSQRGRVLGMMEGVSESRTSSGQKVAPRWPEVANAPGWTLKVVDVSGKALDSLDTFRYPNEDQILTTTNWLYPFTNGRQKKNN